MQEHQDKSFLLSSPTILTQPQKELDGQSPEVTTASKRPIEALSTTPEALSTTPTVSPAHSPRLRAPGSSDQGSETEKETSKMSSLSSKHTHHDSGSKKHSSKSKGKAKNDNWTEVTEPEERRRIQNRIAQRKFREKQKEHKERAERDERNQEHAGCVYEVRDAEDHGSGHDDLSGLPWGSIPIKPIVRVGHESQGGRGNAGDNYAQQGGAQYYNTYSGYYASSSQQQQSWGSRGSSGGEDYQDEQYYCDYEHDQDHDPNGGDGSSYRT
ncbi:hypothetical protein F4802DRAFT_456157 [Xylaria palmicola]|nr:hypothetical protein F4802DRAFT_456157 [Xylaria palmicola]